MRTHRHPIFSYPIRHYLVVVAVLAVTGLALFRWAAPVGPAQAATLSAPDGGRAAGATAAQIGAAVGTGSLAPTNPDPVGIDTVSAIDTRDVAQASLVLPTTTTTTTTTAPPPPPTTTTTTTAPPPAAAPPVPAAAPSDGSYTPAGGVWAELRQCESGGNYSDDTGNGYYGAYQFSEQTWLGLGYTGLPSNAPPQVQDQAAQQLQARSGWGQWPACAAKLGLL